MENQSRSTSFPPDHLRLHGLVHRPEQLAEAVVDTVRECLLILDGDLRVRIANRSFFVGFEVTPEETIGHLVFELGDGQWNIPALKQLLFSILPQNKSFRDFEVTHMFPHLGPKTMLLNARTLLDRDSESKLILLTIEDVTERLRLETNLRERERMLTQLVKDKQVLVTEVHHRVKNNLQTVASLLSLHASHSEDKSVVEALSEARGRVQAIARLHETLYTSANLAEVNFGEYLKELADELRTVYGRPEISFQVEAADVVVGMEEAVPLGLIANELISNSLKHAFPSGRHGSVIAAIEYVYASILTGEPLDKAQIQLQVQDNGVGLPPNIVPGETSSLGLKIVNLLSKQLHAQVYFQSNHGVQVRLTFSPNCVE